MKSSPLRLGAVVIMTAAATLLGILLNVELETQVTYLTFFPTLFACTWAGGRRGGFLSLVLCLPGTAYLLPPSGSFAFHHTVGAWTSVGIFLVTGAIIVWTTSRLQDAVVWREKIISMVSHDLKSPLSTIELQAEMLRRSAESGTAPAEKIIGHADRVTKQVNRLLLMINNLLDMTRVHANRLELMRTEVDLAEVLRDVVERSGADLDQARGWVTIIGGEQHIRGLWDRMGVEQIAANLVNNAIKYGENKPIEITLGRDEKEAWFIVRDQGKGISRQEQRHVFEAFGRGGSATRIPGHGLGLWIVALYAKAHGGRVQVQSEPDAGTAFRVDLPLEGLRPDDTTAGP
jgi:signal transduction histidine kinase